MESSFRPYKHSIVKILDKNNNSAGTGVCISEQYVLTCAHVVCDILNLTADQIVNKSIDIEFPFLSDINKNNTTVYYAVLDGEDCDKQRDIAILKLEQSHDGVTYPLVHVGSDSLSLDIFGFDAPYGRWVSAEYKGLNALGWGQLNPKNNEIMDRGFSGAPVWCDRNQGIVGIIVARSNNAKASYLMPSSAILDIKLIKELLSDRTVAVNPYKGLNSFQREDSSFYFGRRKDIDHITRKLTTNSKHNFFSLIGISGVGKSSFINAGLIPRLERDFGYTTILFRPKNNPFEELALKLLRFHTDYKIYKADLLQKLTDSFSSTDNMFVLRNELKIISEINKPIIIIIDQFEEIFTNTRDDVQSLFLNKLSKIFEDKNLDVKILISLRVDFLENLFDYADYVEILNDDTKHFIGHLDEEQLKDIIIEPARIQNVSYAEGVVERILEDIKNEKGQLPLLEFALTQLWNIQDNSIIGHSALESLGGVLASLGEYAESVYRTLDDDEKDSVRRIMAQLLYPGQGKEDTRQIALLNNFSLGDQRVITKLATKRLIVIGSIKTDDQQIEIIHESLISHWHRLRKWADEYRTFRIWQNKLNLIVADWSLDNDEGYLLRGRQLEEAEEMLRLFPKELEHSRHFISHSVVENNIIKNQILKRKKQILIGLVGFISSLLITTVYSIYQKNIADSRFTTIEKQKNQVLWTYWSAFLDVDRQDETIDNPKVLNTVLNVLDFPSKRKEKAISILVESGINKIKRDKPILSKSAADFTVYLSELYLGNTSYIEENFKNLSNESIWLWSNDELDLFSNLLERTIANETPIDVVVNNENLYKYIISLMRFVSNPTLTELNKLSSYKYFIESSEDYNSGLESILDYDNKIVFNHFSFKKTKLFSEDIELLTKEYYLNIDNSTDYSTEQLNKIKDVYGNSVNSYFNDKKKRLSRKQLDRISKLYLNRVQNISKVLYDYSTSTVDLFTIDQTKSISNMYFRGIYNVEVNSISNRSYPELSHFLPRTYYDQYQEAIKNNDLIASQRELEKILLIIPNNPYALYKLSQLALLRNKNFFSLDHKKNPALDEFVQAVNFVLSNQNSSIIKNLGQEINTLIVYDTYSNYSDYFFNNGNYEKAIENKKSSLNYTKSKEDKSSIYGALSWYYLFIKNYDSSIESALKGLELDQSQIWINTNLAHAYLLKGDFERAKTIYLEFKDTTMYSNMTWNEIIFKDFKDLRESGIESKHFDRIAKLLD